MKIIWTNRTAEELEAILFYIAKDNPTAAKLLVERITTTVNSLLVLVVNPKLGRIGQVSDTREYVVHKSYIVIYRLNEKIIEILSVRHTSRSWPSTF
jgi:addiction module RelE/StbE family toxin